MGSLKMSGALQLVPGTPALVFFLLAAGNASGIGAFTIPGGYIGIISGFAAIYTAMAQVLNGICGRDIAPVA
jgi:succinate-acetate transporter protein